MLAKHRNRNASHSATTSRIFIRFTLCANNFKYSDYLCFENSRMYLFTPAFATMYIKKETLALPCLTQTLETIRHYMTNICEHSIREALVRFVIIAMFAKKSWRLFELFSIQRNPHKLLTKLVYVCIYMYGLSICYYPQLLICSA